MRMTIGMLRRIIREEVSSSNSSRMHRRSLLEMNSGYNEMTKEEALQFIKSQPAGSNVNQDISDIDTGEIYAHEGETFGMAQRRLFPDSQSLSNMPDSQSVLDRMISEFVKENKDDDSHPDHLYDIADNFFWEFPNWHVYSRDIHTEEEDWNEDIAKRDIRDRIAELLFGV